MSSRGERWKNDKLGVSVIIGYVLLVAFAVIMGVIVYNYLKTYVPAQAVSCPDGVSLFVQDANYCGSQLNLTIRNNGRFDVAGYYIRATNSSSQTIPAIDLSSSLNSSYGGILNGNLIMFSSANNNSFTTGNEITHVYNISSSFGNLSSLQIIPALYEIQNNRNLLARCSNSIITESDLQCEIQVSPTCIPKTCSNIVAGGAVCGSFSDGCGGTLNCAPGCTSPDVCSNGQCVPQSTCTDTCTSLGYQCGTWTICGVNTNCGTNGLCSSGYYCTAAGQCTSSACGTQNQICSSGSTQGCTTSGYPGTQTCNSLCTGWGACTTTQYCGDGIINGPEQCDLGSQNGVSSGCSTSCTVNPGWTCTANPSPPPGSVCTYNGGAPSCTNYCTSLNLGYTKSACPANAGQCNSQYGGVTYTTSAALSECTNSGAPSGSVCCCIKQAD